MGTGGRHFKLIFLVFITIALGGVIAVSPYALLFAVLDLPWAAAALLPGVALGVATLPAFRLGGLSQSWHWILSAALGMGLWSNLILILGVCGWLQRGLFVGMVAASAAYLVVRWRGATRGRHEGEQEPRSHIATKPRREEECSHRS